MRVIIAGSRDSYVTQEQIDNALKLAGFEPTEIVSGGAKGVDFCGEEYARSRSLKLTIFQANWSQYGRSAGPRRNREMASYADALLTFWDGKSRGTKNVIEEAKRRGLSLYQERSTV